MILRLEDYFVLRTPSAKYFFKDIEHQEKVILVTDNVLWAFMFVSIDEAQQYLTELNSYRGSYGVKIEKGQEVNKKSAFVSLQISKLNIAYNLLEIDGKNEQN